MKSSFIVTCAVGALMLAGCATDGVGISTGSANTLASGAAAGGTSTDSNIIRCEKTIGTLAVDDGRDQAWYWNYRNRTGVDSIEPLIRQMAQQSNCFIITAAGNDAMSSKMKAIMDEQRESGETRAGSNLQKGQKVATDYFLQPEILYAGEDAGGIGGAALGMIPRTGGLLGGLGIKRKETSVNMSVFSLR